MSMSLLKKMFKEDKVDVFLPPSTFKSTPPKKLKVTDVVQVSDNLSVVGDNVSYLSARALAYSLMDILSYALPRTPVDTGELRESSRAVIKLGRHGEIFIGHGKADGSTVGNLRLITATALKGVRTLRGDIYYFKKGEGGVDVALWTHEDLNPYASGKRPQARTPGTGPHYLSSAYEERIGAALHLFDEYVTGKGIQNALRSITRLKAGKPHKTKFMVDEVVLARYSK